jgi:hypothetical protein
MTILLVDGGSNANITHHGFCVWCVMKLTLNCTILIRIIFSHDMDACLLKVLCVTR